MNPRDRNLPPVVSATLKRTTATCIRAEMAAARASFVVGPLERLAGR